MNNTLVRVKGYITESNILEPVKSWSDNEPKYRFTVFPSDYNFEELEEQIEYFKFQTDQPHFKDSDKEYDSYNGDWVTRKKKSVVNGCNVQFESLFQPRRIGQIQMMEDDNELIGQHVQSVGHLQRLDNGDIVLSCHILENVMEPTPNILDDEPLDYRYDPTNDLF